MAKTSKEDALGIATAMQHIALVSRGFNLGQQFARQATDKRSIPTDEMGGFYRANGYYYAALLRFVLRGECPAKGRP
jgi:hypothetical protein